MSQTSYSLTPKIGKVGAIAESVEGIHAVAKVASVAVPFGCMTVRDADDLKSKLPTSAAEVLAAVSGAGGVAIATHAIVSDGTVVGPQFPIGKEFAQMRKGTIFVLVEEAVNDGDLAYVRYANAIAGQNATYLAAEGGAANQQGAFRKSYDGTAQVDTITPTAVNSTVYSVQIQDADSGAVIGAASYTSDGTALATEIVAGLIAALGNVPNVALSGSATLILTSSLAGKGFVTTVSANLALVHTTANAASAAPAKGCHYKGSYAAGTLAKLEVNLGGN